jgi:hypothetical protein
MFLSLLAQMEPAREQAVESNNEAVKTSNTNDLLFIVSPFVD